MKKQETTYAIIGRFQGQHLGHFEIFKHAFANADRVVILLGSAFAARSPKNPFTFSERKEMIERAVNHLAKGKILNILPLPDYVYDNTKWLGNANGLIRSVMPADGRLILTGCKKDASSSYIDYFQCEKDLIDVQHDGIGATEMRDKFFEEGVIDQSMDCVCGTYLRSFMERPEYAQLVQEHFHYKRYRANAETKEFYDAEGNRIEKLYDVDGNELNVNAYAPTYVTGDAVVTCAGHVLLVKRKNFPGKGLMALPGGFINEHETPERCVVRELREETRLKVPMGVLESKARENMTVFADPSRSLRGRTITHCGEIVLHDVTLPVVKGSDDAEWAGWVPIHELPSMRDQFFEDHYSILNTYLGNL